MKIYIISGLGADFVVLEKLKIPAGLTPVFIPWLIPQNNEPFLHYTRRMAEIIDDSEPFCLLGYSFGGIVVQEIHRIKPAVKVIILGSIRHGGEKSLFMRAGEFTRIPRMLPERFFNESTTNLYTRVRKAFDPKNPGLIRYFNVRDPYYLKWAIDAVACWRGKELPGIIQILGDKDIVFPIKNSKPDYIISGGTHLFPATKHREVSRILAEIFAVKSQSGN